MRVLVVEPNVAPYEKEINGLEEMQATVGGMIEAIYPYAEQVGIVCNEEGLINGLDFNRSVPGGYGGVFGPFFVCGLGEDHFCSLTDEQLARFKKEFHKAEILVGVHGNEPITLKVEPKPRETPAAPEQKRRPPER